MRRKFGKDCFGTESSDVFNDSSGMGDPMVSLVNLSDIMLVFACGLMVALIINWNVDVTQIARDADTTISSKSEIEELEGGGEAEIDEDADYVEYGVVYRDPSSGKFYMVPNN